MTSAEYYKFCTLFFYLLFQSPPIPHVPKFSLPPVVRTIYAPNNDVTKPIANLLANGKISSPRIVGCSSSPPYKKKAMN